MYWKGTGQAQAAAIKPLVITISQLTDKSSRFSSHTPLLIVETLIGGGVESVYVSREYGII